ncbi:hypothetical protein BKA81DRAFT_131953 [Phyllosticta paracitricarpa]|uniref:Uncharacterized protein n=1 Tax=Phyllosticta paracitricarpa TaxID=2016321 RepID=A0ABR1MVP0_9PEZI
MLNECCPRPASRLLDSSWLFGLGGLLCDELSARLAVASRPENCRAAPVHVGSSAQVRSVAQRLSRRRRRRRRHFGGEKTRPRGGPVCLSVCVCLELFRLPRARVVVKNLDARKSLESSLAKNCKLARWTRGRPQTSLMTTAPDTSTTRNHALDKTDSDHFPRCFRVVSPSCGRTCVRAPLASRRVAVPTTNPPLERKKTSPPLNTTLPRHLNEAEAAGSAGN